jgi:hypothetical protein
MPKYFFNIADAHPPIPCAGVCLPSLAAARCHALQYAEQILCDQKPAFWDGDDWVMTVSDESHLALFVIMIGTFDAPSTGRVSQPGYASPAS